MNRITAKFRELAARGEKALIPYLTAGDPDLETTYKLVLELSRAGADILELGVPFSDPLADGPTIQAACQRALRHGTHLAQILELVKDLRRETQIPLVLMGYYNPMLAYGLEKLATDAAAAGVDGFIIPDLPVEEAGAWLKAAKPAGLAPIFLAAPTSGPERIRRIGALTQGFLYYISVTGITGARTDLPAELAAALQEVKSLVKVPVAVGFGISRPEQVQALAPYVDGIVVGSALVQRLENFQGAATIKEMADFVAALKAPLRPH